ncbi:MAG TPA: aspartyl protease family protein [Candidatus Melainabacteria bacterium]|nr:aspartyl protease family protein [Candidatus Melainabacteria bacterium]
MNATIPVNEAEKEKDRLEIAQKARAALDRGRKLYEEKKYAEALEPYLYAFDNGHLVSDWGGVRLTSIQSEIARLGENHPPALESLKERRDAREKLILEGIKDFDIYSEWVTLNIYLKESEHCIKVTKKLSKKEMLDPDLKRLVVSCNLELFLESDEKELVNECLNNRGHSILRTLANYESLQFAPYFKEDPERTRNKQESTKIRLVHQTIDLYRLLLIRNNTDQAKALAERVLESLPDRDLFAGLISLERSQGKKSRAKKLLEQAENRLSAEDLSWLETELAGEQEEIEKAPSKPKEKEKKKTNSKKGKAKGLLLSALILVSLSALGPQQAMGAKNGYAAGVDAYRAKNYQQALTLFYDALKANPRDEKSYYYAALSAHQLGQTQKAITLYKRVMLVAPGSDLGNKASAVLMKLDPSYAASVNAAAASASAPHSNAIIGSMSNASQKSRSSGGGSAGASPGRSSGNSSESGRATARDTLPQEARVFFKNSGGSTRMLVDGRVNGRSMVMLFDTGAPLAGYFSLSHLKELGLPQPDRRKAEKVGGSSNSQKVDCWEYLVDMQVGSIVRRGIPILVLDNDRDTPLLGQEFWKGYTYTIDYGGKSIHFTKDKASSTYTNTASSSRYSVPFTFREQGNRIVVDLEVNGKKFPVMFDTGHTTDATLALNGREQAKLMGIPIPDDAAVTTTSGASGSGTSRVAYVRKMKLGPIEQFNARVHVSDEERGTKGLPLLGQAFYHGWQYTIDMNKKLIHFKRR